MPSRERSREPHYHFVQNTKPSALKINNFDTTDYSENPLKLI
ncbi:hypothetical protein BN903_182 [Halorubrum sp. AJ67]|nr:hypothetical protein BN903_182 [Halorubrum sp. AJ67]